MKIRIISAIVIKGASPIKVYKNMAGPSHEISVASIEKAPSPVESEFDEALAVPAIISRIYEAEQEGCDAVVVNCFADPGESAMHLASILGHKFSILTVLENVIPTIYNNCKIYGLEGKLASIRSIEAPVPSLHKDSAKVAEALILESINAIRKDGAHCIALGCT